jgi:hypothetical protein
MEVNTLEDVELPLRHFFLAPESDNHNDDDMLLLPAPSIRDQIIQIKFEATPPHHAISLSLSVDAGPGCGGIAWPAGEVHSLPTMRS